MCVTAFGLAIEAVLESESPRPTTTLQSVDRSSFPQIYDLTVFSFMFGNIDAMRIRRFSDRSSRLPPSVPVSLSARCCPPTTAYRLLYGPASLDDPAVRTTVASG